MSEWQRLRNNAWSFNVFGIILAVWSSNSKYTLLGSLRAAAQVFSFEMCFITLLLPIFLLNSTFNLIDIVLYQNNYWNCFVFLPTTIYFFIIVLAETNRTPFDLPEAEAELVAGYNLEYSAINFALFFLGEYTNMLLNSFIFVIFFFGGLFFPIFLIIPESFFYNFCIYFEWLFVMFGISNIYTILDYIILTLTDSTFFNIFFFIKTIFVACMFIVVRAILPRYRFDQLMDICWKKILPVSCSFFLFFIYSIYLFDGFYFNLELLSLNTFKSTILYYKF